MYMAKKKDYTETDNLRQILTTFIMKLSCHKAIANKITR